MNRKQRKARLKSYQHWIMKINKFFRKHPLDAAEEFARCLGISKEVLLEEFNKTV